MAAKWYVGLHASTETKKAEKKGALFKTMTKCWRKEGRTPPSTHRVDGEAWRGSRTGLVAVLLHRHGGRKGPVSR